MQPGVCYRLYPKMVHDAMLQFQLPEILRTPLQELCLQIKSLQLGAIASFLAKALQPPDALSVQNAVELLKTIGALDEAEELTPLGMTCSVFYFHLSSPVVVKLAGWICLVRAKWVIFLQIEMGRAWLTRNFFWIKTLICK